MKAIVFDHIGAPADVLYLTDISLPEIKDDEVLVRMVASSIIPGDFLFIQNMYPEPKKPVFPQQIGGNHGSGIIEKTGKDVRIPVGTFVFFTYYNSWAEYAIIPEKWLIELPQAYPALKASQMVNLITAWDLLELTGVKKDGWLVLTAGYSSISLLVAQFANTLGIKIISIVRKLKTGDSHDTLHADAVIDLSVSQQTLRSELLQLTANKGVNGVVDNVGGKVLEELIRTTAFGSKVIINGNMSIDKFELHNNDILFNGIEIKPYIYRYLLVPPKPEDKAFLEHIIRITSSRDFHVKIAVTHQLKDYELAVSASLYDAGNGKHVFIFPGDH